ncbi:MAG TPA: hypothetical protein VF017_13200 [Thermoanaerobaculia bacterium]|nr:hypothetical protein [Thermoanaerobaculia bacterium]
MSRPSAYEEAFRAAVARVKEHWPKPLDSRAVGTVCGRLSRSPKGQRELLLRNSGKAARIEVVRELCEQSLRLCSSDPPAAEEKARRAVEVAGAMAEEGLAGVMAADARALAWGHLTNALRVRGELDEAERACREAEQHLASGSGDPLMMVEVGWFKAFLHRDRRQLTPARLLLEKVAALLVQLEDRPRLGRTRVALARVHYAEGDVEAALACAETALSELEPESPSEAALLKLNIAGYLADLGRHHQALVLLRSCEPVALAVGGEVTRLRLGWLKGRIEAAMGEHEAALAHLDGARRAFLERGLVLDAALLSLDLALAYAACGRPAEQLRLAEEMLPVFTALRIPREATATLLLYVEAARELRASAELLDSLARRLDPLRRGGACTE